MNPNHIENKRFQFEKEKFEKEFQIKEKELALKEKELLSSKHKISHTTLAFGGAVLSLLGIVLGAILQGYFTQRVEKTRSESSLKLEKQKFASEIVLRVATSDSIAQNKKNLKFMIDAGFLSDDDGKIRKIIDDEFDFRIENYSNSLLEKIEIGPQEALICNATSSYAYHKAFCRGLKGCPGSIRVINIQEAEALGRRPCGFCY
jgi:hypothetical protein